MRFRIPFSPAIQLASLLVFLFAVPARAVVVQGFEVTAHGDASVSAVMFPDASHRKLVVTNIGASGQDGPDLPMYRASGLQLQFDDAASPEPITRRNFTLYTNGEFPGDKVPIIKGSALGSGGNSQRKINCPYVFTVTVQVWDGSTLKLSKDVPVQTAVTVSGGSDVTTAGTIVRCYTTGKGGGASTGKPKRLWMGEQWPTPRDVTVDGTTVSGDQLVFEVVSTDLPDAFDSADLLCATNIAAALHGNVVIGDLSIIKDPPYRSPRMAHAAVAMSLADDMHHVTDTEAGALTYSLDAAGPGGGGGGEIHLGDADGNKYINNESCTWSIKCPTGWSSFSTEVEVLDDDGSGLPPAKPKVTLTFQGAIPTTSTMIAFASLIPGDVTTVQAFSEGRPVGQPQAAGLGTHIQCSAEPGTITLQGGPFLSGCTVGFPSGTTFDIDGQQFTGDAIRVNSQSTNPDRRISDIRIVHPPGSPPGTWRLTDLSQSVSPPAEDVGGRDLAARGPRQTVSLDGTYSGHNKRVIVPDVPNGGIEMALNGAPSVAIESAPNVGDPPLPFESMALYDCDDGDCDAASQLDLEYDAAYHVVKANCQWDESPQLCGLQLGHTVMSMASADPDGDGAITVTSANAAIEPRPILKSYRWVSPSTECMTVGFADPVQVQTLTGVHVVTELTFWRNLDGNPAGKTKPKPKVVKTSGLPPGEPYIGTRTIPIRPPAVESSGNGIVRADVGTIRAGVRVTSTWATASNVRVVGDTDGDLRVTNSWQPHDVIGLDPPVLEATTSDPACPGFVYEFTSSGLPLVWSPRSNIYLYGRGDMAGMPPNSELNGIEFEDGAGLPAVVRYIPSNLGGNALVTLSLSGLEVGSATTNEVEVSRRFDIVLEADTDGDGVPEIDCRFAPGTTATLPGHPPVSIDQMVLHPQNPSGEVLRYSGAGVSLNMLPPGQPNDGKLSIARIMAPGSDVDVPPAAPPTAGLELRSVTPNPARGTSTVRLTLGRESRIRVQVLDIAGREVARLADGVRPAGENTFPWSGTMANGGRAAAGLYLVRVSGDGLPTQTTRMIRLD